MLISEIPMKRLLLCLTFTAIPAAHAADWTPVFKVFEKEACGLGEHPVLEKIILMQVRFNKKESIDELYLDPNAKKGNYSGVPQPYRSDMQAAVLTKFEGDTAAYLPLKNAKLYGLNIVGYTEYSRPGTEVGGMMVHFAPMQAKDFQKLKKIKFLEDELQLGGVIAKDKKGNVLLECHLSI